MDVYGNHLQSIAETLQRAGFAPSVRGEGTARFVFAESHGRAVELYWGYDGFMAEFFEDPAEVSVRDIRYSTPTTVTEQAIDWLSRHDGAV